MPNWRDCWGVPIRVTDERLRHLVEEHPEMVGEEERIAETLLAPEVVVQSESDSEVRLYHRLYKHPIIGEKHLCAVVKWHEEDRFLLTAHFTDKVKRGAVLWTKK